MSSFVLAVALAAVSACGVLEPDPQAASRAAATRASARAGRSIRAGCHGLVTRVAPGLTGRHERAQLRRRGHRCRSCRGGVRGAPGRRRTRGGHRRAAPRRRRVLLLRLHPVQGAAAPRPGAGRGAAHPRRGAGGRRPRRAGRARAPRRDHQPPPRRQPDAVARRPRHRARARPRADHRRAQRAGRRRDARRAASGGHRHRHRGRSCRRSPGCARRARGPTARR